MFSLAYVSSSVGLLSCSDLLEIMTRSVANNARAGLTGILLYKDGNLIQVLEGEEDVVMATYAKIGRDPRHRGLITLLSGPIEERQFPGWSMGFRDLDCPEVRSMPGFGESADRPLTESEFAADPTGCRRLLETFRRTM